MILLTGATGLIGGHLLMKLYKDKKKVRALIRKTSNFRQLMLISDYYEIDWLDVYNSVEWVYGDVQDEKSLIGACSGVTEIYHCAAVVSMDGAAEDELSRTNVNGTELICKVALAQHAEAFCMVSSIAAIGTAGAPDLLADEDCKKTEAEAGSDYSLSKFRSEEVVWKYIEKGLPAVIVNPGVVLGVGLLSKGSMKIFETGMKGIPFYTKGGTGYVDVRDVVSCACMLVAKRIKGERFILVSENATYAKLFTLIADRAGVRRPYIPVSKPLLELLGSFSSLIQFVSRKQLKYTRSVLLASGNKKYYLSEKIIKATGVRFIPLEETINDIIGFIGDTKK